MAWGVYNLVLPENGGTLTYFVFQATFTSGPLLREVVLCCGKILGETTHGLGRSWRHVSMAPHFKKSLRMKVSWLPTYCNNSWAFFFGCHLWIVTFSPEFKRKFTKEGCFSMGKSSLMAPLSWSVHCTFVMDILCFLYLYSIETEEFMRNPE